MGFVVSVMNISVLGILLNIYIFTKFSENKNYGLLNGTSCIIEDMCQSFETIFRVKEMLFDPEDGG
jgi:hypothetical protein